MLPEEKRTDQPESAAADAECGDGLCFTNNFKEDAMARARIVRKAKSRRKKSKIKFLAVLVMAAAVFLVYFLRSDRFIVRNISVEGNSALSAEEVIISSTIYEGQQLFAFKSSALEEKIKSDLAFVKDVSVRRVLPDSIRITVTEREPSLLIKTGGEYALVDPEGRIISKSEAPDARKCIVVSGLSGIEISEGADFEFGRNSQTQTVFELMRFFEHNKISDRISEIHIGKDSYYVYTKNSNVIKFFNYSAFRMNEDFLVKYISEEKRSIMVEVIEGRSPVSRAIEIQ